MRATNEERDGSEMGARDESVQFGESERRSMAWVMICPFSHTCLNVVHLSQRVSVSPVLTPPLELDSLHAKHPHSLLMLHSL